MTITQIISIAGAVQWGIRQSVILENEMTSVERVIEYSNLPQETKHQSAQGILFLVKQFLYHIIDIWWTSKLQSIFYLDKLLSKEWPNQGKIMFQDFGLQYSPDAPFILKNLNFTIQPKEKVIILLSVWVYFKYTSYFS